MTNNGLDTTMDRSLPVDDDLVCDFDWQQFIFDPTDAWIGRLTRLANRRFANRTLAEEAFNFALERVSSDGWRLLANYTGQSSPGTFLVAVFSNAMEDFARRRFGRPRPPAWLARLGNLWKRVYRMLCLERMEPETIVDWLTARGDREPEYIREVMMTIRARICSCGQMQGDISAVSWSEEPDEQHSTIETPEAILEEKELATLLGALAALLEGRGCITAANTLHDRRTSILAETVSQRLPELEKSLEVTDQERLLLRQVYQEGRKIAAVARILGLPEQQARRTCKRAVERLRKTLQDAGINSDFVKSPANE